MGGAVSSGETNDELIDNLIEAKYIRTKEVEKIFRAVDRAHFYPPEFADAAYKDLAWKHPNPSSNLHISAPCIYSEVMEALDLKPGLSFLNLGSGTGYLSTMVGLWLGTHGVNHGVELHPDAISYAHEHIGSFCSTENGFEQFDFCQPQFTVGNCLLLESGTRLYDRVYCGAGCPPEHENYMKNLIKIGGILVLPINDQLTRFERTSETEWTSSSVLPVSFASLLLPDEADTSAWKSVSLPSIEPLQLRELCRSSIRSHIRRLVDTENPDLLHYTPPARTARSHSRRPRVQVVNMAGMGMMLLGRWGAHSDDDEDEETVEGDGNEGHVPRRLRRLRELEELMEEHMRDDDSQSDDYNALELGDELEDEGTIEEEANDIIDSILDEVVGRLDDEVSADPPNNDALLPPSYDTMETDLGGDLDDEVGAVSELIPVSRKHLDSHDSGFESSKLSPVIDDDIVPPSTAEEDGFLGVGVTLRNGNITEVMEITEDDDGINETTVAASGHTHEPKPEVFVVPCSDGSAEESALDDVEHTETEQGDDTEKDNGVASCCYPSGAGKGWDKNAS